MAQSIFAKQPFGCFVSSRSCPWIARISFDAISSRRGMPRRKLLAPPSRPTEHAADELGQELPIPEQVWRQEGVIGRPFFIHPCFPLIATQAATEMKQSFSPPPRTRILGSDLSTFEAGQQQDGGSFDFAALNSLHLLSKISRPSLTGDCHGTVADIPRVGNTSE